MKDENRLKLVLELIAGLTIEIN